MVSDQTLITVDFPDRFAYSDILIFKTKLIQENVLLIYYLKSVVTNCFYLENDTLKPLSANPTKWSNTLEQFVGKFPTNCLSASDHFVGLALKVLKNIFTQSNWLPLGRKLHSEK